MSTRWMHPELAVHEDVANATSTTLGPGARFCFHVDRTITDLPGGMVRAE